jgi:hypothetical protein
LTEERKRQVFGEKIRKILPIKKDEVNLQFRMLYKEEGNIQRRAWIAKSVYCLSYGLDDWRSIPGGGRNFSYSPPRLDWLCCPRSLLSNGYQGAFSGLKRRGWGGEAEHSYSSSAEVKNTLSSTSTPAIHVHDVVLS